MKKQRGGFVIGFVVGLLVGLALALGVALYVTKVPAPFINKVPAHSAQEEAEQAEKNKNWDPNRSLYGKNPAVPHAVPASEAASESVGQAEAASASAAASAPDSAKMSKGEREARALLGDKGDGEGAASAPTQADGMTYYVQAGAFSTNDEAQSQRARLAIMGLEARVSQREQNGKTMYRVRIGPFDNRPAAEDVKARLATEGMDAAIARVPH